MSWLVQVNLTALSNDMIEEFGQSEFPFGLEVGEEVYNFLFHGPGGIYSMYIEDQGGKKPPYYEFVELITSSDYLKVAGFSIIVGEYDMFSQALKGAAGFKWDGKVTGHPRGD